MKIPNDENINLSTEEHEEEYENVEVEEEACEPEPPTLKNPPPIRWGSVQ